VIVFGQWGYLKLAARGDVLTDTQKQRLERARAARTCLNVAAARLLAQLVAGEVDEGWQRDATNPDRVNMSLLLKLGVAEEREGHFRPTRQVLFDLGLEGSSNEDLRELFRRHGRPSTSRRNRRAYQPAAAF
jgi:hypothetical protein